MPKKSKTPIKKDDLAIQTYLYTADRKKEITLLALELDPKDYLNEEAYKQALVEQYRTLRQKEYQYTRQNEDLKAYNDAAYENIINNQKKQNQIVWDSNYSLPTDSTSCYDYTRPMAKITDNYIPKGCDTCAISANALTMKCCEEMGYGGDYNLIIPKSRITRQGVTSENNAFSAREIHKFDSIDPQYKIDYSQTPNNKRPTLNTAIKNGTLKAGDEFSVITNPDTYNGNNRNVTTSGCHAMVVVDVKKDNQGKVINYTISGNNPPALTTIDVNNPGSARWANRQLNSVIKVNDWMQDKIENEATTSMSAEELKQKINDTQDRLLNPHTREITRLNTDTKSASKYITTTEEVDGLLNQLQDTEETFARKELYKGHIGLNYTNGYVEGYLQNVIEKNTEVLIMDSEKDISSPQSSSTNIPQENQTSKATDSSQENQTSKATDSSQENQASKATDNSQAPQQNTVTDNNSAVMHEVTANNTIEMHQIERQQQRADIKEGRMYKGVQMRSKTEEYQQTDTRTAKDVLTAKQEAERKAKEAAERIKKEKEKQTKEATSQQQPVINEEDYELVMGPNGYSLQKKQKKEVPPTKAETTSQQPQKTMTVEELQRLSESRQKQ